MSRKPFALPLAALAAAAIALLLTACGGSDSDSGTPEQPQPSATATATPSPSPTATPTPEPTITVSSPVGPASDGDVTLSIPEDALPDGVSPSDLKIESITPDDLAVSIEDAEVVAAFRLLPDGLVLSEPATVTLQMPAASAAGGLVLLHLTSEGLSPLGDVAITIDDAGEVATLQTTITHFSDLAALKTGFFTIEVSVDKNTWKVGETFTAGVLVRPTGAGFRVRSEGPAVGFTVMDNVFTDGGSWSGNAPAITPDLVSDRPPLGNFGTGYSNMQDFTCAEETTSVSVAYRIQLEYEFQRIINNSDGTQTVETAAVFGVTTIDMVDSEPIDCVLIPPITAELFDTADVTWTRYTLDVDQDSGYTFAWSGTDCGTPRNTDSSAMFWYHSTDDCEHTTEGKSVV